MAYSVGRHHNICFSLVELLFVYLTVSRHCGVLQHEKRESPWMQNMVKVTVRSGISHKNAKCTELVQGKNKYLYLHGLCTRFRC